MIGAILTRDDDLAKQMPADLALFFRAMYQANRQRVQDALVQLAEIGAALSAAAIPAVVLKGGSDILSPIHVDPATRYVGDLDVLVPANRAQDAAAALCALGAAPAAPPAYHGSSFDWRGQRLSKHHLPRLVCPDWTFPVEIHVQAGPGAVAAVLDPDKVFGGSVPSGIPGLSVASHEDRACHLLTHTTRHNGALGLRAWIDWSALRRQCDQNVVASRLHHAGFDQTFESCGLMADLLEAEDVSLICAGKAAVSSASLINFGTSEDRSLAALPPFIFRRLRALIFSQIYRDHIGARLAQGDFFHDVLAKIRAHLFCPIAAKKMRRRPK